MDRDGELGIRQPESTFDDDLELGADGCVSWYLNGEVEGRRVARFDAVVGERRGPVRAHPVDGAQRRVRVAWRRCADVDWIVAGPGRGAGVAHLQCYGCVA